MGFKKNNKKTIRYTNTWQYGEKGKLKIKSEENIVKPTNCLR